MITLCKHVFVDRYMGVCLYVSVGMCKHVVVDRYIYIYMCIFVCMYGCMYVCMYVWVYVCMYVCIFVCMYVCTYVCERIMVAYQAHRKSIFVRFRLRWQCILDGRHLDVDSGCQQRREI